MTLLKHGGVERAKCIQRVDGLANNVQGHRLFQIRVGPARFEGRPTIRKRREVLVGRRGEAPLVPPYSLRRPNKAMALNNVDGNWK